MHDSDSKADHPPSPSRLCDISTRWSLIFAAHRELGDSALAARRALMERYFAAVYRYLLAVVHEADVADDLAQDFALRFLRGGFRHLDPRKGRFRDYVKAALQNLLNDHFQAHRQPPGRILARIGPRPARRPA